MNKYKIIVFDLDGTLVDSLQDLADSVNKGLAKAGLPIHPYYAYKQFVGNGRDMLIKRAMGDKSDDNNLYKIVYDTFDLEYKNHCNDNTCSYDGCSELLKELENQGIKTAVLSNKPDEFVEDILNKIYPNHKFDLAWGQKPDLPKKPDGTSLLKMIDLLGLIPADCLYVGDSDVDVYTAQNAGVDMLGVSWGFRGSKELKSVGAKVVVDNAMEILEYI